MLALKTLTTLSVAAAALAAATNNYETINVGNANAVATLISKPTVSNEAGCRTACSASASCELYYFVPSEDNYCVLYSAVSDITLTSGDGLFLGIPGSQCNGSAPSSPFPSTFEDTNGAVTSCVNSLAQVGASPAARMARRSIEHRDRLRARAAKELPI